MRTLTRPRRSAHRSCGRSTSPGDSAGRIRRTQRTRGGWRPVLGDVRRRVGPGAPQDAPQPLAESEIRDRVGPVSVQRDDRPARRGRGLASQACREARERDQNNGGNRDAGMDPSARTSHAADVSKVKASPRSAHGPLDAGIRMHGNSGKGLVERAGPRGRSHAGHETHCAPTSYRARIGPVLRHDMP